MADTLSPAAQTLIKEKIFANLATLMKDGSPHVTTVWVDTDGKNVLINSSTDRVKVKNMERDPRVAISVVDPADGYRSVIVRGKVKEIAPDQDHKHINSLSAKYTGNPVYQRLVPGVTRLRIVIEPERVIETGL